MIRATLAVPGDITTPTGGYGYARRLLEEAPGVGLDLSHLALPGGFPAPEADALERTAQVLAGAQPGAPILIDALALGVLPAEMLRSLAGPVVALCHHPLALETGVGVEEAARFRQSEKAALGVCAGVVATSSATARILQADYGVPAERLTVAPPGTDTAPRARGSGGPGVAILSVGSLTPRKGHDRLIVALAGLVDLDWHLTIVGPADRDDAHADELRRAAAQAGLASRITFTGALDADALAHAYDKADLFALASRYEGFGMAYTEAMARGLPVLGCAGAAVAEATRGAALLVPQDDGDALRSALARLISDQAARDVLAADCQAAARNFTRWPETAGLVAHALRNVAREMCR